MWFGSNIKNLLFGAVNATTYLTNTDVECEHKELPETNKSIGLDLGISDLLITSNGETFENNKLTYKYEKKLAKLQRRLAKKQKGSKNFNKQRIKIAKLHEKIHVFNMENGYRLLKYTLNVLKARGI